MPLRERELGNDFFCFKAKMSRLNYGEMFDRRCAELIFRFQANDLERRTFNTTFSTIAILVTWKFFQAMWFRSFYSIHGFKAFSFSLAFHVRPVFSYGILGIYSNYKTKTCLSGRLRLPLVTNSNHRVLLQAYIDVSECPLRNQLIRNYLENDASLELWQR